MSVLYTKLAGRQKMRYDLIRGAIKTGDLLAWSAGGWTNWHDIQISLVRMFTQSEFSHVGMACVFGERVFILEAVGQGVRLYPLSKELPFYYLSRPRELSEKALNYAFEQLGERYSKWQAIKSFFGAITIGSDDEWECAEYIMSIYGVDGEHIPVNATPTKLIA